MSAPLHLANSWVKECHRHHEPVVGHIFSLAVLDPETMITHGVATTGRPSARGLDDGATVEVTRVATDGTLNACSCLYGAAAREAKRRGFKRAYTYTLASEPGTSLIAAGWIFDGIVKGRRWDTPSRRRSTPNLGDKKRWLKVLAA